MAVPPRGSWLNVNPGPTPPSRFAEGSKLFCSKYKFVLTRNKQQAVTESSTPQGFLFSDIMSFNLRSIPSFIPLSQKEKPRFGDEVLRGLRAEAIFKPTST